LAELFGWLTLCLWNPYFRRICDFPSGTGLLQLLLSDLRYPLFSGGDPFIESENHRPLATLAQKNRLVRAKFELNFSYYISTNQALASLMVTCLLPHPIEEGQAEEPFFDPLLYNYLE